MRRDLPDSFRDGGGPPEGGVVTFERALLEALESGEPGDPVRIDRLLDLGAEDLGMPVAYVTRLSADGDRLTVLHARGPATDIRPGVTWTLASSPCRQVIAAGDIAIVEEGATGRPGLPGYVGAPIHRDGEVWGTVGFGSEEDQAGSHAEYDRERIRLLRRLIADELKHTRAATGFAVQSERLEELASTASHDLRNPLTVANGRLELARDESESQHLDSVQTALERLEALVDGIVTSAREGEAPIERGAIDLSAFAGERIGDAGTVGEGLGPIRGDPDALARLLDLLTAHARNRGGVVRVGGLEDGFFLEHDGRPIPDGWLVNAFEWGVTDREDEPEHALPLAAQICAAHGWDISLTDTGTRFEVTGVERIEADGDGD